MTILIPKIQSGHQFIRPFLVRTFMYVNPVMNSVVEDHHTLIARPIIYVVDISLPLL